MKRKSDINLYLPERHETLTDTVWSEAVAKKTIKEIVELSLLAFEGNGLWPVHPDLNASYGSSKPIANLWVGAAGSIWALDVLAHRDSDLPSFDFEPYLANLDEKNSNWLAELDKSMQINPNDKGYLLGLSGIKLLQWKLTQNTQVLDELAILIKNNQSSSINEFMFGAPGTILVAWFLYRATGESRWKDLFLDGVDRSFLNWQYDEGYQCYIWTQALFNGKRNYLALIHGFTGNAFALIKGVDALMNDQRNVLIQRVEETLFKTAEVNDQYANWLKCLDKPKGEGNEYLLQLCHGAPGIIIPVIDLWDKASHNFKVLLLKAGELIWHAGPLKKPWGLCHGTAGNGYAFLKLYKATGDQLWLDRARQFAMHAIEQYQSMKTQYGEIRTDGWCGDLGLALYLQDCIHECDQFPMLDYF